MAVLRGVGRKFNFRTFPQVVEGFPLRSVLRKLAAKLAGFPVYAGMTRPAARDLPSRDHLRHCCLRTGAKSAAAGNKVHLGFFVVSEFLIYKRPNARRRPDLFCTSIYCGRHTARVRQRFLFTFLNVAFLFRNMKSS